MSIRRSRKTLSRKRSKNKPITRQSTETYTTITRDNNTKKQFKAKYKKVIYALACKSKKGSVNTDYLIDIADTIMFLFTVHDKHRQLKGYVAGSIHGKTFYTDVICGPSWGRKLDAYTLKFALEAGCTHMALRASEVGLIRTYKRYGYSRRANACEPVSRSERQNLRKLDGGAVSFRGELRGGTTKQTSVWDSSEGWWMSKCISNIPVRKASTFDSTWL
jgi:hypothetical protein